ADISRSAECHGRATVGDTGHDRLHRVEDVALDDAHHDMVAFEYGAHGASDAGDDTRGLVAEHHGHGRAGPTQLVQLGVADATGEKLDFDLRGAWIRQVDIVDHQRLAELHVDGGLRLHTAADHI